MKLKSIAFLTALVATPALSHSIYTLPSDFTISDAKGDWVSFDVSATNVVFSALKPASAEKVRIFHPDGTSASPDAIIKGKRRSTFDYFFDQAGTYKVVNTFGPSHFTVYQDGDQRQRLFANKAERDALLPNGAEKVNTLRSERKSETYVTVAAPNDKTLALSGKGFEMKPHTHPADIIEGEQVTFQYFYNGKPAADIEVVVTPDGVRYRNDAKMLNLKTDKDGKVSFTPEMPGRYLAEASYSMASPKDPLADRHSYGLNTVFEAQLD
ncbi:DUF4198 domain-containing protein [Paraferrimonas sedimenticola]|uniref:Nickel transporter n=1 Tax=Paraferrimonas sedimenticola TaxID=375674 RepID=A0AA37RVD3_9GAMM|nr:DUF4198 domain-containing protein [Paraferrimonas sedimenticola]GLP95594.1 nickel transporter [Paraferrimonas sedimenticola]